MESNDIFNDFLWWVGMVVLYMIMSICMDGDRWARGTASQNEPRKAVEKMVDEPQVLRAIRTR